MSSASRVEGLGVLSKLGTIDKRLRWIAVLVWMIVIFAFSQQPYSGRESEKVLHDYNVPVRKAGHITEYLVLFVLVRWAIDGSRERYSGKKAGNDIKEPATAGGAPPSSGTLATIATGFVPLDVIAFLAAVVYAGLDEWHQSYVPGRSASLSDVGVDTCGIFLGLVLWLAVSRSFPNRKRTTDSTTQV